MTMPMTDDVLAKLLDRVEHRYYGKYRAFVVQNDDPKHLGRLRLRIPSVLGPDVVSGWAMPCAPYGGAANQGFFFIPEEKAGVWVEFESGLLEYPVWVGTFWCQPGGETEVPAPAKSQTPPTSKMIKTLAHTIELADQKGSEAIKIFDSNNNKVTIDSSGILIEDKSGNKLKMEAGGVTLETSHQIKIGAGAAAEKLVLGTSLVQLLAGWHTALVSHVHPTTSPGSPTGPAASLATIQLPQALSLLSQHHVVE
jgi:hypothetical protein